MDYTQRLRDLRADHETGAGHKAALRPRSVKWDLTDRRGAHGAH